MAVFQYKDGFFVKTTADQCGGFARRQLVLVSTKGTAELKPLEVPAPGGQYTQMRICKDSEGWTDLRDSKKRYL